MSYKCIVASVFLIVKAPYSIFCFLKTPIDKSRLIIIIIISIATNIYTKRGIVQMSKNNFEDKSFLTYNQQMKKLRKDKKILWQRYKPLSLKKRQVIADPPIYLNRISIYILFPLFIIFSPTVVLHFITKPSHYICKNVRHGT